MSESLDRKSRSRKVPGIQQFAYAFGQIPERIMSGIFAIMYVEFFWEDLGLIDYQGLFIAGQVIYATINSLNDPLFGYLTDKTNIDRWGSRRLIHIRYGAIIWGILFVVMWFPWSTTSITIIFIHKGQDFRNILYPFPGSTMIVCQQGPFRGIEFPAISVATGASPPV